MISQENGYFDFLQISQKFFLRNVYRALPPNLSLRERGFRRRDFTEKKTNGIDVFAFNSLFAGSPPQIYFIWHKCIHL